MKEYIKNGALIIITSLLLPCLITILCTETAYKVEKSTGMMVELEGENIEMEEFLIYMVAGQMEITYDLEALKAQAVIARTNLLREADGKKTVKAKKLTVRYLMPEQFEEGMGEKKKAQVLEQLKRAVEQTSGEVLLYENQYIEAMYHAVSIGTTVSSEEIYGVSRPYLCGVPSSQDVESREYMNVSLWTEEELKEKLKEESPGKKADTKGLVKKISVSEKTKNGYVKQVSVAGETISGEKWQEIFSLPSGNFYLEEQEGMLRMITLGKGHGMGLSQYGADCLAKEGWGYREILEKYYPGTEVKRQDVTE